MKVFFFLFCMLIIILDEGRHLKKTFNSSPKKYLNSLLMQKHKESKLDLLLDVFYVFKSPVNTINNRFKCNSIT